MDPQVKYTCIDTIKFTYHFKQDVNESIIDVWICSEWVHEQGSCYESTNGIAYIGCG